MKWGEENGDRKNILELANYALFNKIEYKNIGQYSVDKTVQDRYFKDSDVQPISTVLNKMAKSNRPLSKLAKHLSKFIIEGVNNVPVVLEHSSHVGDKDSIRGYFDGVKIAIARDALVIKGNIDSVILHEVIHAITYNLLRKDSKARQDLQRIYDKAKEQLENWDDTSLTGFYGTKNIDEFVAEIFTNGNFIKSLDKVAPVDDIKYKSMWREIIDFILDLLKINKKDSLYTQATDVIANLVEENNIDTEYELLPEALEAEPVNYKDLYKQIELATVDSDGRYHKVRWKLNDEGYKQAMVEAKRVNRLETGYKFKVDKIKGEKGDSRLYHSVVVDEDAVIINPAYLVDNKEAIKEGKEVVKKCSNQSTKK
jgi:hypothetical protein